MNNFATLLYKVVFPLRLIDGLYSAESECRFISFGFRLVCKAEVAGYGNSRAKGASQSGMVKRWVL